MPPLVSAPASLPATGGTEAALAAYDTLAPDYDAFTEGYEYERWLGSIERWARSVGLEGRCVLDVACGTGKSFAPMLKRGYEVAACDLSPAMVAEAAKKHPGVDPLVVADMRDLPWVSQFHLVTCIDDAVNYLLEEQDLAAALRSMHRALRPGGILVFDTNSLLTYRTAFAGTFEVRSGDRLIRWHGGTSDEFAAGEIAHASVEVMCPTGVATSRHVQRHWPVEVLLRCCEEAGFDHVECRGQITGCHLLGSPDEDSHTKVVWLAVKDARAEETA